MNNGFPFFMYPQQERRDIIKEMREFTELMEDFDRRKKKGDEKPKEDPKKKNWMPVYFGLFACFPLIAIVYNMLLITFIKQYIEVIKAIAN